MQMLNTQIPSTLRGARRESGIRKNGTTEKTLPGKTRLAAYKNRWSPSHVWSGTTKNDCMSISGKSSDTNDSSGTQNFFDEEKQENNKDSVNPLKDKTQGHFNSKFNNRAALSLHPPVSMGTENSGLFYKAGEIDCEDSKRIVRILEKARVERNKIVTDKHLQRECNETIGEKTIKLAREKNTLPEGISRRHYETETRHFLPRINDKVWPSPLPSSLSLNSGKTFSSGHEDVEDPRAPHPRKIRSVLAWSACVFPAILVDFPVRKNITSFERKHKRVKRNADMKRDLVKPAAYTELDCPKQRQSPAERPLSRMLYPSHHGHSNDN